MQKMLYFCRRNELFDADTDIATAVLGDTKCAVGVCVCVGGSESGVFVLQSAVVLYGGRLFRRNDLLCYRSADVSQYDDSKGTPAGEF